MSGASFINLQGIRVHNLQNVDLQIPLRRLVVFTGVSGSGKSSLAFDTLYVEGQRRFMETLSPYARQFFDQYEKPDGDRIDNIPPAIAIHQGRSTHNPRSTVATATEIQDYLQILFARLGRVSCLQCREPVDQDSPQSIARELSRVPEGTRFQIGFPVVPRAEWSEDLLQQGFTRVIADGRTRQLAELADDASAVAEDAEVAVVVDRVTAGRTAPERIVDSLETAFRGGDGRCLIWLQPCELDDEFAATVPLEVDGQSWQVMQCSRDFQCPTCGMDYIEPEPRLLNFNSPLGACPACRGYGTVSTIHFDTVVPDPSLSLQAGAIAPWLTPAYAHELQELQALADDYEIALDVPFSELDARARALIMRGIPERNFGGLEGFLRWLERHQYKAGVRAALTRWRSFDPCPTCTGSRLRPEALAVELLQKSIAQVLALTVSEASEFIERVATNVEADRRTMIAPVLRSIRARLHYLQHVGLEYVTLDRTSRSLSGGEAHRVALTAALGTNLVNTLYVLDEPTAGLHPRDVSRLMSAITGLRDLGNTVVVVEHDPAVVSQADWVVDFGPGAGRDGGQVVFAGTPHDLQSSSTSTGDFMAARTRVCRSKHSIVGEPELLRIRNASRHNLQIDEITFPLNTLTVVSGVSGSGKSSLVNESLYPALCAALGDNQTRLQMQDVPEIVGSESLNEVLLVSQESIGRSSRSNPITYIKAFDEVRRLFAATPLARSRDFQPGHFSFNSARGGRCPKCEGQGIVTIDMHFLPDMEMTCPDCHGRRFERGVLEVKYLGLTIAEVLDMTVAEAFTFFRNQPRIQRRLQSLKDVGLGYVPLGQPTSTLSGGESQRLKLASYLHKTTRSHTLFLLDEPTVGLHRADVQRLLTCFEQLLAIGHSLIVVEHDLDLINTADHVIDLGPGAGEAGGRVVAAGTPDEIAACRDSITGQWLQHWRAGDLF